MPTVLVVDDDIDMQNFVSTIAKAVGCETDVVASGQEAIDALTAKMTDIAFVDLNMPGMNGWDTVKAIRALPGGDGCKIIVLSGQNTMHDREDAHEAGCDRFVDKPVTPEKIIEVIQAFS